MVIFAFKLFNNVRKAIAGRRYPHQLAGGVALGVLMGIIPHGNLLAVFVLVGVLCFRVNHAMLALVAVGCSFAAKRLDPFSHVIGEYLLTHPVGHQFAVDAWKLPLVPWTDLNNTVVAGSFVIGLCSVLPVFYMTLPFFKWLAPAEDPEQETSADSEMTPRVDEPHPVPAQHAAPAESPTVAPQQVPTGHRHSVVLVEPAHQVVTPPRYSTEPTEPKVPNADADRRSEPTRPQQELDPPQSVEPAESVVGEAVPSEAVVEERVVETRIDVIRMKDYRPDGEKLTDDASSTNTEQPMDEALNYLLRQLRNSQQRKAG
ncbi:MAG: TIGR03546 family protein [Planctomycetota bacterium]